MSSWGRLPCSLFTVALRTSAMLGRWRHQLLVIRIVALGLHTENTSDCGLAVKIDGAPLRRHGLTDEAVVKMGSMEIWNAPFSHHLGILSRPIFNCHFFFSLIVVWHLSISRHATSYTLPERTCSWHFGFNGQIEKIKMWPEGSHLISATDVWK